MKIIVTGSNGMLGNSLCGLYNDKHDIHSFHRDKKCYSICKSNYSLDLRDFQKLKTYFNQIKPDLIIHCAGMTNVDDCEKLKESAYESNVLVSENIARLCQEKTKLIYISTDQVYGVSENLSEANGNLKPLNEYGKTKLLGENKVRELCSNYIIIRTNIFWSNIKPGKISSAEWIYNSLYSNKSITLFSDYTFSSISAECLGIIIMQLVKKDFFGIINAGSANSFSKYEFGMQLANQFCFDSSYIKKGLIRKSSFTAKRSKRLDLNVNKLKSLGISPPDLNISLKKFAKSIINKKI